MFFLKKPSLVFYFILKIQGSQKGMNIALMCFSKIKRRLQTPVSKTAFYIVKPLQSRDLNQDTELDDSPFRSRYKQSRPQDEARGQNILKSLCYPYWQRFVNVVQKKSKYSNHKHLCYPYWQVATICKCSTEVESLLPILAMTVRVSVTHTGNDL